MRAAIIGSIGARSLDVLIEKLAHRRRALQADDHMALRFVVTTTLNEAAAVNVAAFCCPDLTHVLQGWFTFLGSLERFTAFLSGCRLLWRAFVQ